MIPKCPPEGGRYKYVPILSSHVGPGATPSSKVIVRLFSEHDVKLRFSRFFRMLAVGLIFSFTRSHLFGMIRRAEEMRGQANPTWHWVDCDFDPEIYLFTESSSRANPEGFFERANCRRAASGTRSARRISVFQQSARIGPANLHKSFRR